MQLIINFIIKYKYFLFFLLLEIVAISFTIQGHSYHKSKFVNSANFVTGGLYKRINSFKEYTNLRTFNQQLLDENTRLKNILSQSSKDTTVRNFQVIDTTRYFQKYTYIPSKVIHNQYHKKYNYLTLDKGSKNGVTTDLGVVNSNGIIGITNSVSENYATVLSILNENAKINVKLLRSLHFGTLEWDGRDYNILQLVDLPIQANIKAGDTIVSGGKSTIFPEGIPVGTIMNFSKENNSYSRIDIKLFNDMSAIGPVNIVINLDKEEIKNLEQDLFND